MVTRKSGIEKQEHAPGFTFELAVPARSAAVAMKPSQDRRFHCGPGSCILTKTT
jgi:hypothetical protein